ncbi:MAG: hypothetical protein EA351_06140 [Gemmatimonadales bacterium]|nr:MAG: hypothetical protein EA351_06140 [Gemmatimonadales bacterium]
MEGPSMSARSFCARSFCAGFALVGPERSPAVGAFLLALLLAVTGCDSDGDPAVPQADTTVVAVEVDPQSGALSEVGQTIQLSANARNADHRIVTNSAGDFTWSSAAPEVASVDAQGLVTAQGEGETVVTASLDGQSGGAVITVDLAVAEIELTPVADTLRTLGASRQFAVEARTSLGGLLTDDPADFTWASSDPAVATVDEAGRVTAESAGSVTLTAELDGVTGEATVVVDAVAPGEFPDGQLESAVRQALDRPTGAISAEDLAALTVLDARQMGIQKLTGLEHAVNLEEVDLAQNEIQELGPLGRLSQLREADLAANSISDISPLEGLEQLELLNLAGSTLTEGLEVLAALPGLRDLRITGTGVSDLSFLAGAPVLENLQASAMPSLADLSGLEEVATLERLHITNSNVANLTPLTGLTGLRTLAARGNPIEDLAPLADLTALEFLTLGDMQTSDISPLSGLVNLTNLTIQNVVLPGIEAVSGMVALESIILSENEVADLSPLEGLEKLNQVFVVHNLVEDLGPLVANQALGEGTMVQVSENPLSQTALCQQIPALEDRGVRVFHTGSC